MSHSLQAISAVCVCVTERLVNKSASTSTFAGFLFDEDSCNNIPEPSFGHHGNGRPGSADFSHNTSSSNSPVNCRGERKRPVAAPNLTSCCHQSWKKLPLCSMQALVSASDPSDRQLRSASLSSDDVMGLSQSQLALSRSSTLPYDHAPQRAQPQRGGAPRPRTRPSSPGSEMVTLEEFLHESNIQSPPMVKHTSL